MTYPDPLRGRAAAGGLLVGLAVAVAAGVAVIGGYRSFDAVSHRFGSPLVPLTADGMILACTALRLAALTRGWRLPGSLVVTYGFIGGTVWLNVAAAHGWAEAVAHALAPVSYAVLVEMLSGQRPFHKDSGAETMAAILRDPPAGLHAARLASPALARIARRCLQKEPGDRHRDTAELVADLCAIRAPKPAGRPGPHRLR